MSEGTKVRRSKALKIAIFNQHPFICHPSIQKPMNICRKPTLIETGVPQATFFNRQYISIFIQIQWWISKKYLVAIQSHWFLSRSKTATFPQALSLNALAWVSIFKFLHEPHHKESCGYLSCDSSLYHFDVTPECDRQMDSQTDISNTAVTALCTARYEDELQL